jgi:CRP/FNR family transcriptional regulator
VRQRTQKTACACYSANELRQQQEARHCAADPTGTTNRNYNMRHLSLDSVDTGMAGLSSQRLHSMDLQGTKVVCNNCELQQLCMPVGLSEQELASVDDLVGIRRKVRRHSTLFRNGEKFTNLYAVRTGFFKTSISSDDGRDQVIGFQMAGDMVGLDGIVNDHHSCDAVALEDAEVCVMPFHRVEELSRSVKILQRHVHKLMSREIVREHGVMLMLGSMRADERLAAFLLNLVRRLHARGLSHSELILRMTREEIGSYLGLNLETVSRTFSRFVTDRIVAVQQRHIHILNTEALRDIVIQSGSLHPSWQ